MAVTQRRFDAGALVQVRPPIAVVSLLRLLESVAVNGGNRMITYTLVGEQGRLSRHPIGRGWRSQRGGNIREVGRLTLRIHQ
jgi:hypothetical protein